MPEYSQQYVEQILLFEIRELLSFTNTIRK